MHDFYMHSMSSSIMSSKGVRAYEAETSHNKPSVTWKPRRAGGIIPIQIRKSENHESQWCKSHGKETNFSWP